MSRMTVAMSLALGLALAGCSSNDTKKDTGTSKDSKVKSETGVVDGTASKEKGAAEAGSKDRTIAKDGAGNQSLSDVYFLDDNEIEST